MSRNLPPGYRLSTLPSSKKGALPILYAALDENVEGGDFIGPDGLFQIRGYPTKVNPDEYARDEKIAKRLWGLSEEMTGIYY